MNRKVSLPDIVQERNKYYKTMTTFAEKQEYLLRQVQKYRLPDDPPDKLRFYFEKVRALFQQASTF